MKKKNGFTLIELLAVIVILAIIALIAVPIVLNLIERSRKGAAIDSAYGYKEAINEHYLSELIDNPNYILNGKYKVGSNGILINTQNEEESYNIEVSGSKPSNGEVTFVNNVMTEACLIISGYKVTLEDGKFISSGKGECDSSKQEEPQVEESPKDWFTFENHDDGTATITGLSQFWHDLDDDNKYDIAIPSKTSEGNVVTIIKSENDGFYDKTNNCSGDYCEDEYDGYGLTSVIIPNTVMVIEKSAFEGVGLESVDLGNGVQIIGNYAFYLNNFTNITIPNSVTEIGDYAFASNNITSVDLGNGVQTIGEDAFANNKLTNVTIPKSVEYLSGFRGNHLTEIDIPEGVQTIGDSAFQNNNLTGELIIPNSVQTIGEDAFFGNNLTGELIIPNSVTTIGDWTFTYNNLTSVIIPNSVTTIGALAFQKNKLESVDLGNGVQTIDTGAFDENNLTGELIIPSSVTTIGGSAFYGNNLTSVTIPESVLKMDYRAFGKSSSSNPNLTTIINKTGKAFDWHYIIYGNFGNDFETGIVGNVTITNGNE